MRQAQIDRFGGPEEFYVTEAPDPEPGPGQVRLKVEAAGVNPIDYKIRDGSSGVAQRIEDSDFPLVLGRECCGIVEAVGEDADLEVGQRVYGMVPLTDPVGRCYAEKVALPAQVLAPAPDDVDPLVLAGTSLVCYTAHAAALHLGQAKPGDVVIVHGAGGGVGQIMVQMCVNAGATVFGTCSAGKADRVRSLGATPIDYTTEDFREVAPLADLILDAVYFDTFEPSLNHLAEDGRIVVLPTLADISPALERGIDAHIVSIDVSRETLTAFGQSIADGALSLEVTETFDLEHVGDAHRRLQDGHTRGKIVLDLR